jgi:hypothetical protein
MKRRVCAVLAVLAACCWLGAGVSLAAGNGNVYLVVNNSHCPNGGTIKYLEGAVWGTYSYTQYWSGGDGGDNILYPRVQVGQNMTFAGYALCYRGSASVYLSLYFTFTPSRNGGTNWY